MSVKTYVPSSASGSSYVNMLNEYVPGVAANWSLNVVFGATTGEVLSRPDKEVLPLIYDEWVSFYVCIDLDDDRVDMFYGNQTLVSDQSWKNGFSGGGQRQIAVLNLWAGEPRIGITGIYFDEARLEAMLGVSVKLNATPNPVVAGDTMELLVDTPALNPGARGALFVWSINDTNFRYRLKFFKTGIGGQYKTSFTIPGGLAGLDIGMKAIVLPPSGAAGLSNEELILFR